MFVCNGNGSKGQERRIIIELQHLITKTHTPVKAPGGNCVIPRRYPLAVQILWNVIRKPPWPHNVVRSEMPDRPLDLFKWDPLRMAEEPEEWNTLPVDPQFGPYHFKPCSGATHSTHSSSTLCKCGWFIPNFASLPTFGSAAAGQRRVLWTRIVVSISHNSLFNKGLLVINFHQTSSGTESHPKWVEAVCWCGCLLYLCGGGGTEETTRHQKLIC